jgi:ATP-dependent Lon protease
MVMALASRFSDQSLPAEVGITGEITLRGRILPVGGVKMKVLAAHRAGLKTVYLPARNQTDLDELPPEAAEAMNLIPVDHMDAVFERLLMGAQGKHLSSDDDAMIPLPDTSEGRIREKTMVACN